MVPQPDLFVAAPEDPDGLSYRDDFIDREEEAALLAHLQALPIAEARYRQYTARRRTASFGHGYDFTSNWEWQHSIPDVPAQRWSITFRTLRA